jgi:hypothetical protein
MLKWKEETAKAYMKDLDDENERRLIEDTRYLLSLSLDNEEYAPRAKEAHLHYLQSKATCTRASPLFIELMASVAAERNRDKLCYDTVYFRWVYGAGSVSGRPSQVHISCFPLTPGTLASSGAFH